MWRVCFPMEVSSPNKSVALHYRDDRRKLSGMRSADVHSAASLVPRKHRCRIRSRTAILHPGLICISSECASDLWNYTVLVEFAECSVQMSCGLRGKHCIHPVTLNRVLDERKEGNQCVIGKGRWFYCRVSRTLLLGLFCIWLWLRICICFATNRRIDHKHIFD